MGGEEKYHQLIWIAAKVGGKIKMLLFQKAFTILPYYSYSYGNLILLPNCNILKDEHITAGFIFIILQIQP
jgi:hypothetical protein